MHKETLRPAWVEINLGAIRHNVRSIKKLVDGRAEMVCLVKADAYGHGIAPVMRVMKEEGYNMFAVATLPEAVELRKLGYAAEDVWVLGLCGPALAETVVEYDILTSVDSYEYAKALSDAAEKQGKKARGIIALDTGMARIGYRPDENYIEEIKMMDELPAFEYIGCFSHMCNADTPDKWYMDIQKANVEKFLKSFEENGIEMKMKSFANSASVQDHPELYYTHVRPGIILYGMYSDEEVNKDSIDIIPAMQVKANIMKIKEINEGDCVGYGCAFTAERKSKIATLNLGYADGLPRVWGQKGCAIVNGVMAPYAGNVCMDQCMLDVTDVPDVKVGDEVIIMGSDGKNSIRVEDIAKATGRLHHEIFCSFKLRMPRLYKDEMID